MSKIQSIIPVVLDSFYQEVGTILIEINSPVYDFTNESTRCNINFYKLEEMRILKSATWEIPNGKTLLLGVLENGNDALQDALAVILLEKVQSELLSDGIHTIFNLLPDQWQLSNEILEKRNQNQLPVKEILKA